jgi:hypothetical protein
MSIISSIFERKPLLESNDYQANHLISILDDKLTLDEIITNNENIKVISILGEARKGKSTLLNTIISSYTKTNQKIFKTSKSLDHCTQGIDYLYIPELNLVFCDVQGLKVGNSANDPKLLLITYLMSDIIVFTQQQMLNKSVLETFSPLSSFLTYIDFEQLDKRNRKPELIFRISDFTLDGTPKENLDKLFIEHEDQSKNIIINMKRLFGKISAYNTNQLDRSESKMLDNLNFYNLLESEENGFSNFIDKLNTHISNVKVNNVFSKWYENLHEFTKLINDNKKIDFNKLDVYKLLTEKELYEYHISLRKRYPDIFNELNVNHTQTDYETKICSRIKIKDDIVKEFNHKFAMVNDNLKKEMYDEITSEINKNIELAIKSNHEKGLKLLYEFVGNQAEVNMVETKLDINSTSLPQSILNCFVSIEQFIINKDINDYVINEYKMWKKSYIKEYSDFREDVNEKQSIENNKYFSLVHDFINGLSTKVRDSILLSTNYIEFLQKPFNLVKDELIYKFTHDLIAIKNVIIYSIELTTIYNNDDKLPTLAKSIITNPIDYTYEYINDIYKNGKSYIENIDMKDIILKYYIKKKKQILKSSKLYNVFNVFNTNSQMSSNIATVNEDICKFYKVNSQPPYMYVPIYQYKKNFLIKDACKRLIKDKLVLVKKTHMYANIDNKNYMFNSYKELYEKLIWIIELPLSKNYGHNRLTCKFYDIISELQIKSNNSTAYNNILKANKEKKDIEYKKYQEKLQAKKLLIKESKEEIKEEEKLSDMEVNENTCIINGVKSTERQRYRKRTIPSCLKRNVWDEYIGANTGIAKCMCCKLQDIRQIEFHCGHIIPESLGGGTNLKNLRPICAKCNLSMGNNNMIEFMERYGFGKLVSASQN